MKSVVALLVLALAVGAFGRAALHLAPAESLVKDQYIVVLHNNVSNNMRDSHLTRLSNIHASFVVTVVWEAALNGYGAIITDKAALEALLEEEVVSYVEQDQMMYAIDTVSTQNLGNLATGLWGLNRVWQRTRAQTTTFQYYTSAGAGVDVYIVDTGLSASHTEFTGRTATGISYVTDPSYPGTTDGNGHGTHVSSTAAGTTYGLAKKATIIPVKVLSSGGSGTNTGVISGVNWVASNYASRGRRPSVANMSLGGGASAALDDATNNVVNAGVSFAVAAGNENQNACNVSPARATNAITTGATTIQDARASFSNFGTCVKIFSPGNAILGAWIGSTTATNTISGTSMASPHTAGAIALMLGHNPSLTPAQVRAQLTSDATRDAISSVGTGSLNVFLYTPTTLP